MTDVRMEVDYSVQTESLIEECRRKLSEENYLQVVDSLAAFEKQTRAAPDSVSTGKLLSYIVEIYATYNKWTELMEFLIVFSKKRGQLKQAVTKMVQNTCTYIDATSTKEIKIELITTLRKVTEGKIYVEVERARLTKMLAEMYESDGDLKKATAVLLEIQVETFGSMEKREKTDFILEQIRLCLTQNDFVRAQIISKKISLKYFEENDTADIQLRFYRHMIQLQLNNEAYFEVGQCYLKIYRLPLWEKDEKKKLQLLSYAVVFLLLTPYNNEQADMMHRLSINRDLEEIVEYQEMLNAFIPMELLNWASFKARYQSAIDCVFKENTSSDENTLKDSIHLWDVLRKRCMEHNIRIMSGFYTRITLQRVSQLLSLSADEVEQLLSDLVINKTVYARIDRLEGVVEFIERKNTIHHLDGWASGMVDLMNVINRTNHLIKKERMIWQEVADV